MNNIIYMFDRSLSLLDEKLKNASINDAQKNELLQQKFLIAKLKNEYKQKNGGI